MFDIDFASDTQLTTRSDPATASPHVLLNQTDMITRDEHLLRTIEQQLTSKKRVLVSTASATGPRYPKPSNTSSADQGHAVSRLTYTLTPGTFLK